MKRGLLLPLLVVAACSPAAGPGASPAMLQAEAEAAPAAAPSDAEIAAIVVVANRIDAELGDLAASRAENAEVREFGKTMSRDHRAVNEQAGELVTRLGVTPQENDLSRQLEADAAAFRSELEGRTGADFDRAYMEHEVAYHQAVIGALDDVLVPAADNAELKQTLVGVRPAFVAHLQHAEQLAAKLK